MGVAQAKPACKHTIATRKCYQYNTYNCVGAVKYGLIKYYLCGGHLEIQYGRHAKCILLYSSSTEQDINIFLAAAPTFVVSRKQMGRFINCFTVVIL